LRTRIKREFCSYRQGHPRSDSQNVKVAANSRPQGPGRQHWMFIR